MSSNILKKIALFIFVNVLGFMSSTAIYYLAIAMNIFTGKDEASIAFIQNNIFTGTGTTWVVCAIFSTAYFFIEGVWGHIFLWATLVIPLLYGLNILLSTG